MEMCVEHFNFLCVKKVKVLEFHACVNMYNVRFYSYINNIVLYRCGETVADKRAHQLIYRYFFATKKRKDQKERKQKIKMMKRKMILLECECMHYTALRLKSRPFSIFFFQNFYFVIHRSLEFAFAPVEVNKFHFVRLQSMFYSSFVHFPFSHDFNLSIFQSFLLSFHLLGSFIRFIKVQYRCVFIIGIWCVLCVYRVVIKENWKKHWLWLFLILFHFTLKTQKSKVFDLWLEPLKDYANVLLYCDCMYVCVCVILSN